MKQASYEFLQNAGVFSADYIIAIHNIHIFTERAKSILRKIPEEIKDGIFVGHSGGKDSIVVYDLVTKFLQPKVPVLHTPKPEGINNETDIETVKFLYSRPFSIMYIPLGNPLPEGFKTQVDGTRREEYNRKNGKSIDFISNGVSTSRQDLNSPYSSNGILGLNLVYPIYDWTDAEVWAYIAVNELEYSREYDV